METIGTSVGLRDLKWPTFPRKSMVEILSSNTEAALYEVGFLLPFW